MQNTLTFLNGTEAPKHEMAEAVEMALREDKKISADILGAYRQQKEYGTI